MIDEREARTGGARMTHADLVDRAARWLRNTKRCGVVLTEWHSWSCEVPDAIGWTGGAHNSFLVECKTTRNDFYADKKKPGRRGAKGLPCAGRERYYMAPKGILSEDLVARHRPGWGLLEVERRRVRVALKAIPFGSETRIHELPMLYSYVRRVQQYGVPLDEVQNLLGGDTLASPTLPEDIGDGDAR